MPIGGDEGFRYSGGGVGDGEAEGQVGEYGAPGGKGKAERLRDAWRSVSSAHASLKRRWQGTH